MILFRFFGGCRFGDIKGRLVAFISIKQSRDSSKPMLDTVNMGKSGEYPHQYPSIGVYTSNICFGLMDELRNQVIDP